MGACPELLVFIGGVQLFAQRHSEQAAAFKRGHHRAGDARQITQLRHRQVASLQSLKHGGMFVAQGPLCLKISAHLLGRGGQAGDLSQRLLRKTPPRHSGFDRIALHQASDHGGGASAQQRGHLLYGGRRHARNGLYDFALLARQIRRQIVCHLQPLFEGIANAGGQHGAQRVEDGAKAAIPDKEQQSHHGLVEQRRTVEQRFQFFEGGLPALLADRQHKALGETVGPSKGDDHPRAALHIAVELCGDMVVILPVQRITFYIERNPGNHVCFLLSTKEADKCRPEASLRA